MLNWCWKSGLRKHDGRSFRFLQAGEYTQMSGRAGRRGLDAIGHVMVYFQPVDRLPLDQELKAVLAGTPMKLKSAFRLTYSLILNILRVDELRVEDMMKRSFAEATDEVKLETVSEVVANAESAFAAMGPSSGNMADEDELVEYASTLVRISELSKAILPRLVMSPKFSTAFASGRLVIVMRSDFILSLAVILASSVPLRGKPRASDSVRVLCLSQRVSSRLPSTGNDLAESVLIEPSRSQNSPEETAARSAFPNFVADGFRFCLADLPISQVVWFGLDHVDGLPTMSMALGLQERFIRADAVQAAVSFLSDIATRKLFCRESCDIQQLKFEPHAELAKIGLQQWSDRDQDVASLISLASSHARKVANVLWNLVCSQKLRTRILSAYVRREQFRYHLGILRATVSARHTPDLLPEYQRRVQVLQKLHYVGDDGVSVLLKGRSGACEVATVDSVLLTEIILENTLDGLESAEVASLLSSLVCRKKNKDGGEGSSKVVLPETSKSAVGIKLQRMQCET
jgi:antiviral helicase SKI2